MATHPHLRSSSQGVHGTHSTGDEEKRETKGHFPGVNHDVGTKRSAAGGDSWCEWTRGRGLVGDSRYQRRLTAKVQALCLAGEAKQAASFRNLSLGSAFETIKTPIQPLSKPAR
jgi:hypothetical protein